MKKLGYVLYVILLCFVFINSANAQEELMHCEYAHVYINKEQTQYIRYRVNYYDDKSVIHEYYQASNANFKTFNNSLSLVGVYDNNGKIVGTINSITDNFTASEMQKYYEKKTCPHLLYKSTGTFANSITPVETNNVSTYTTGNEKEITISANNGFYVKPQTETETPTNIKGTCVYEASYNTPGNTTNTKVTCNVSNSGVSCSSNNLSVVSSGVSLLPSSFKSGNAFKCPSEIYALVDATNNKITNISLTKGTYYDTLKLNKSESTANGETEQPEVNEYESDSRYIAAKADYEKYCNDPRYKNNAKCEEATNKMQEIRDEYQNKGGTSDNPTVDLDNFCSGAVQGIFTTLGWIFYVLKILVPIILMIFGTIDFTKAIIASKDDEIKTATKSLIIRTIAGIVIFFIPSILGFIVDMIDKNEVYKGTFWDCTRCMLDPNDSTCHSLGD